MVMIFFNGQRILQINYWRNSLHRDTLAFRTKENPHLGPKSVNTRPKARQCSEVKPAQFNYRTSDRAYSPSLTSLSDVAKTKCWGRN
ncbi:hypothetical protein Hanom_Chr10g00902201 [Helianthus anomalus]